MAERLLLADPETARDLLTFAGRAARVGADGVRLQASGGVLRASTATLSPTGLLDATPTVLGMRILASDPELVCDFVVPADGLRASVAIPSAVVLPDTAIQPAWAGIAPPQSGWEHIGAIAAQMLTEIATEGIARVAEVVPTDAGEDVVRIVRASVWGAMDERIFDLPGGVAFTADALGFIKGDEEISVFQAERWTRLSLRRGHVLSRGPARTGLTPVRATGSAHSH